MVQHVDLDHTGITGGTPADPELAAIAGLTSAADKGIQFTGSGTAATYDLTAAGKALLDDANAAAQLVTLGVAAAITGTKIDDLTAGDDNTDLNASTTKHGLLLKLNNSATAFLNGQGAWTTPAGSGGTGQGLVDFGFVKRTAGDLTLNSTTWADAGVTTITLTAASGDRVEVGLSGLAANEATNLALDIATIVSAAPVNYLGASGGVSDLGVQSWLGLSGVSMVLGGSVMYALQAGDIDTGTVVLRLQYRTTAATNKTLRASATQPLHWHAKNLGAAL